MEAPTIDSTEDPIANKETYYTFVDSIVESIANRAARKAEEKEASKTENLQSIAHELYILLSNNMMTEAELEEEISRLQTEKVLEDRTDVNILKSFIKAKFKQQARIQDESKSNPEIRILPRE